MHIHDDDEIMNMVIILNENCTGKRGAEACKDAHKAGASVHMILKFDPIMQSLIMPTWHFVSVDAGYRALINAYKTAPMITSDAELYAAREAGIPHLLPVGWIDPTRR